MRAVQLLLIVILLAMFVPQTVHSVTPVQITASSGDLTAELHQPIGMWIETSDDDVNLDVQIYRNGSSTLVLTVTANERFTFYAESHELGWVNYTVVVTDTDGYTDRVTMILTVIPDATAPQILDLVNATMEAGGFMNLLYQIVEYSNHRVETYIDSIIEENYTRNYYLNGAYYRSEYFDYTTAGEHNYTVVVTEANGPITKAEAWITVTPDITAPIIDSIDNQTLQSSTEIPTIGITDGNGGTAELFINGSLERSCSISCYFNFNSIFLDYGVYNLTVYAMDSLGHEAIMTRFITIKDMILPTVDRQDQSGISYYHAWYHFAQDLPDNQYLYFVNKYNVEYSYILQINGTTFQEKSGLMQPDWVYFDYQQLQPLLENRTQYWNVQITVFDIHGNQVTDEFIYTTHWSFYISPPLINVLTIPQYTYHDDVIIGLTSQTSGLFYYEFNIIQDGIVVTSIPEQSGYGNYTYAHNIGSLYGGSYEIHLSIWDQYAYSNYTYPLDIIDEDAPQIETDAQEYTFNNYDDLSQIPISVIENGSWTYEIWVDDYQLDTGSLSGNAEISGPVEYVSTLGVGTYNITVMVTDEFGNSNVYIFSITINFELTTTSEETSSITTSETQNTSSDTISNPTDPSSSPPSPAPGFNLIMFIILPIVALFKSKGEKKSNSI